MSSRVLNIIRILLVLAFLVAAAATPTLAEAKTKKSSSTKRSVKKMKITFDGNETPSNEPLRPRASQRSYETPGETVHMRAQNIDDIWAANGGGTTAPSSGFDKIAAPEKRVQPKTYTKTVKVTRVTTTTAAAPRVQKTRVVSTPKAVARGESAIVKVAPRPAVIARATPKPTPEPDFEDMTKEAKAMRVSRPVAVRSAHRAEEAHETTDRPQLSARTEIRSANESIFGNFKYSASFDNSFTVGQSRTVLDASGRDYVLRNELTLGATAENGWGVRASVAFNSMMNVDTTEDYREFGDPSLTVVHPTLYQDRDVKVAGSFRYYLPFSYESKLASTHHFAYSLTADIALPSQMSISNILTPRYFAQSEYAETDAYMMLFDSTEFTKQIGSGIGLGIGQQTRIEAHHMTATGTLVEAYPLVSFSGLSNVLLQAKAFFPVVSSNVVGSAPIAAGVTNLQAEFFAKISF